ncbi:hypothetical protein ACHAWC_004830 [Mediolabrus comicus]
MNKMSSPALPYSPGAPLLTPAELQKFEGPLIAMAQQANGSLPKLLYAFFSFLHRRTDFYCILPEDAGGSAATGGRNMGFKEGQAEQILLASFRQFPLRKVGPQPSKSNASPSPQAVVSGALKAAATANASTAPKTESEAAKGNQTAVAKAEAKDVTGKKKNDTDTNAETASTTNTKSSASNKRSTAETSIRYTDDGKQMPIGNGGSTSRYVWTQTLEEVTVYIPLPNGTRAKDLNVKIDANSLSVKKKDGDHASLAPLEGMFFARIRPDECTWTIESSESITTLQLTLDKVQKTWWEIVLSGDKPLIDATMVDSSRHIDTYDEKTQAQIRRIIFDQRQERLGLPPSDKLMRESKEGSASGEKIPPLPSGVEYIDGETLDKATISK